MNEEEEEETFETVEFLKVRASREKKEEKKKETRESDCCVWTGTNGTCGQNTPMSSGKDREPARETEMGG